ncbi:hypothetical protein P0M11_12045 [Kaistella sp. PBT33-4]|uniref:hypothetical protein n=1 Tax=Kaistella sp. PBT33-4 TaxID=3032000 RepID=UPI0023D8AE62|nr:hypothetical protein [Kaistella sp. PBT33-4]MDF0720732.1 hypothetical protein [Kaistella sp. PBT33-4]
MYNQEKVDDFIQRSEEVIQNHDKDGAFHIISAEIEACEDKYLNEYITALNFIRSEKVLDWIEKNTLRIIDVGLSWGHLAASSQFNWDRATKWLEKGRPLSLIALDALVFCTTIGERLNQSPWMRQIQPKLIDNPRPEIVAARLQRYLGADSVPRTKDAVRKIIENIYDARH